MDQRWVANPIVEAAGLCENFRDGVRTDDLDETSSFSYAFVAEEMAIKAPPDC